MEEKLHRKPESSLYALMYKKMKSLSVIIADDDEISRIFLAQFFKEKCKHIALASNGLELVELFNKYPHVDLILLDLRMPVMDGYIAARKIREIDDKVVIVAETAYSFKEDYKKALSAGCNEYIIKPVNSEEVYNIINKYF